MLENQIEKNDGRLVCVVTLSYQARTAGDCSNRLLKVPAYPHRPASMAAAATPSSTIASLIRLACAGEGAAQVAFSQLSKREFKRLRRVFNSMDTPPSSKGESDGHG